MKKLFAVLAAIMLFAAIVPAFAVDNEHTVTFYDTVDEKVIATITAAHHTTLYDRFDEFPEAPDHSDLRKTFAFYAGYEGSEYNRLMDPDYIDEDRQIDLIYADWTQFRVDIVYGLTGDIYKTEIVDPGQDYILPEAPGTDDVHVFLGYDFNGEERVEGDKIEDVHENFHLTAQFGLWLDVNLDKTVNTGDATMVLRYAAELIDLTKDQFTVADYTKDQVVNTADATVILRVCVGLMKIGDPVFVD